MWAVPQSGSTAEPSAVSGTPRGAMQAEIFLPLRCVLTLPSPAFARRQGCWLLSFRADPRLGAVLCRCSRVHPLNLGFQNSFIYLQDIHLPATGLEMAV